MIKMRFPRLPIGQRFSYRGKIYCKTGPLTASEEDTGKSCLIMKSAEVTPLDAAAATQERKQRFSRREVEALCTRYRADLRTAILDRAGAQTGLAVREVLEMIEAQALSID
jgi:hypothetical protein